MPRKAVIRVDGAPFIGIGHIMRCLTLATALKKKQWDIHFIARAHENHFSQIIEDQGFQLTLLKQPETALQKTDTQKPPHAHWLGVSWENDAHETQNVFDHCNLLIVDHYGIDARWHKQLRSQSEQIMVIDDLADRPLDCDIVLDQTFGRDPDDYKDRTPSNCIPLVGSNYMLLRENFSVKRQDALEKRKTLTQIQNVFICMGSGDPQNRTSEILMGLEHCEEPLKIDIVLSSKAVHLKATQDVANKSKHDITFNLDSNTVDDLMINADIAFGAGGTMSWERCCLGLPTILTVIADNQKLIAEKIHDAGAVMNLGEHPDKEDYFKAFKTLQADIQTVKTMSEKAAHICDGLGTNRTIEKIIAG